MDENQEIRISFTADLGDTEKKLDKVLEKLEKVKDMSKFNINFGVSGASGKSTTSQKIDTATKAVNVDSSSASSQIQDIAQSSVSATQGIIQSFLNVGSVVGNTMKNAASMVGGVFAGAVKTAGNAVKSFAKSSIDRLTDRVKNSTKGFTQLFSSLKRIAMYRALRTMIKAITDGFKEGTENAYRWAVVNNNQLATSLDSIKTESSYLKNSIGAMVAPIINALVPAIQTAVSAVVDFINALNQLFAIIGGQSTWIRANKQARSFGENLKSAGGAAKALTTGIDELNILSDSSGGGGADLDYAGMFEEVEVGSSKLKDALENGEWMRFGSMLADSLNDAIANFDAQTLGLNIGSKIENAIEVAYGFISGLNTAVIGQKIAEFFNNALIEIDTNLLGKTVAEKRNKIYDLFINAIETFNWSALGQKISDYMTGVFTFDTGRVGQFISSSIKALLDLTQGFLEQTNWASLGETVIKKIGDFVSKIDWSGIVNGAFKTLGEVLGAGISFIYGVIGQLFTDIGTYLSTHSISEMFEGLWNNITNAVNSFLDGLGITIDSGFTKKFNDATTAVKDFFVNTWKAISSLWNTVATWFNNNVIQPTINFFQPIVQTVSSFFKDMWLIIRAVWQVVSTWFNETVIQPTIKFFQPIVSTVSTFFSNLWNAVKGVWQSVSVWFNNTVIQPTIKFFEPIVTKIGGFFNSLWDGIKIGVKSAINYVIDIIERGFNRIINAINWLLSGFNDVAEWAGNVLGEDWSSIGHINPISLPRLYTGGFMESGQLYSVREGGIPEYVGRYGTRAAVANNEQIVDGIAYGVADANENVVAMLSQILTTMQGMNLQVNIGDKEIGQANERYANERGVYVNSGAFAGAY